MAKILNWTIVALFAIIGWAWTASYAKLAEIEKGLVDVRVELARMQVQLVTHDEVVEIIHREIGK